MKTYKNINELIDSFEPRVRRAFQESLVNVRSDVQAAALVQAIRAGDITGALEALGLGPSYFRPLEDALRQAHLAAGDWTFQKAKATAKRQGAKVVGQFDSRNLRAESILRQYSSDRIVSIAESTRQAVADALATGIRRGTPPRTIALDLAGRLGPSGVRTGGIIGLDPARSRHVVNMREALSPRDGIGRLRSTPESDVVSKFWIDREGRVQSSYTLRNRNFDPAIKRALQSGQPLSQDQINKMTTSYTGRLQRLRAESIARTELLGSMHAAQDEGVQQMIDGGQIEQENVSEWWDASADRYTRDDHRAADNQRRTQGEPFDIGGYQMMRPGDSSLGAPAEQIINCRCIKRIDMDFLAGLSNRLSSSDLTLARALL